MYNDYNEYSDYSNPLYVEIKGFLNDSEQVLWIGKPCQSVNAPMSIPTLLFSVFWLGFAILWTVLATAAAGGFGLFGLPFLCIGVYLVYNTTAGQKIRYKNTVYAVTNKRALIVYRGHNGSTCNDYHFKNLQGVALTHVNGNAGTICFGQYYENYGYYGGGMKYRGRPIFYENKTSFVMVDNVHDVYKIISEQISG